MRFVYLFVSLFMFCSMQVNASSYSYGDTLKYIFNMASGNYSDISALHAYIYFDPVSAITGASYIDDRNLTLLAANDGGPDTLYYGVWPIPVDAVPGEYFVSLTWTYSSINYIKTKAFKVGPFSVIMADTLGGYGYINEDTVDGAGEALGPIYLPGSIPADGANILIYYAGTNTLAGINIVDGAGNFTVWVDAAGTYDVQISYPGFSSGKRTGITPTVP